MYGLDLFSGIGGITKALDGYVRPVAYCDIEPYARAVLLSRMATGDIPAAPVWDDVTTLRGSNLPHIDIVYGGFPCQDISVAGKQVGLGGERSGLFFEIMRLARETGAEWIFLENVPNIRTKGLGRVLKELVAGGYDCRWGLLSAADMGAVHKRERWFLLAHSNSGGLPKQDICPEQPGRTETLGPGKAMARSDHARLEGRYSETLPERAGERAIGAGSASVADTTRELPYGGRTEGDGRAESSDGGWWDVEPNVGRVANGIPKRVDRLRALGNAVVPAQVREAFERLMGLK